MKPFDEDYIKNIFSFNWYIEISEKMSIANIFKFGKSTLELLNIKKNFINENNFYVKRQNKIAQLYSKQKKRFF